MDTKRKPVHSVFEFVGLEEVAFRELVKARPGVCAMPLCERPAHEGRTLCWCCWMQFRKAAKRTFLWENVSR